MKVVLLAAGLLAALAVVLGFVIARQGGDGTEFRGSPPPEGIAMPAFEVDTGEGSPVSSSSLRGKAVAITFLDTECTEACPIVAKQVGDGLRLLDDERDRVVALAFSVDPANDTPARIRSFLTRFQAQDELRYVDASVEELRPVWEGFDVLASADTGDSNMHSAPVRIYDTEGQWRSTLHPGVDLTPANLAHDLQAALG
jgi:protein SCO1/2